MRDSSLGPSLEDSDDRTEVKQKARRLDIQVKAVEFRSSAVEGICGDEGMGVDYHLTA